MRLLLSGLCLFAVASIASAQSILLHTYGKPDASGAGVDHASCGLPLTNPYTDEPPMCAGEASFLIHSSYQQPQTFPQPDGNPTLEDRLKKLELQLNQLQNWPGSFAGAQEPDGSARPEAPTGVMEPTRFPYMDMQDGFYIRSPDGVNFLRITGQVQADYHAYLRNEDTTDLDTFEVRRARLGIEGTFFNYFEYRFLPDFGQGKVVIQDAYANVHYIDEMQVEVGKFKQPISYEEVDIMDRFVPFLERSIIDQLTPARDPGIMLHGENLFTNRLNYYVSLCNGGTNSDLDTNDSSDCDARILVKPFNSPDCWCCLRGLQCGVSGGFGFEHESINPSSLHTPAGITWFTFNSTVFAEGIRTRLCPEVAYFYGPFGFAAEYMDQHQEMRPASTGAPSKILVDLPTDGFFVMGTVLLTGEDRNSYSELSPLRPFDFRSPWSAPGAWELAARVSRLEVGDQAFAPGPAQLANPALWSRGATELTTGFNWYLNKWVRVQVNWEHAWFDQPVELGSGAAGKLTMQNSLITRFQIIF